MERTRRRRKPTVEEYEQFKRNYRNHVRRLSPKRRSLFYRKEELDSRRQELEWTWSFNGWLRNAGGALVGGGGAVALAYLVGGLPINYQPVAFFYVAYAFVLGFATWSYWYVKRQAHEDRVFALTFLVIALLYYGFVGFGTFIYHSGVFAPQPKGWPMRAYTRDWWKVIVASLTAAILGLGFRISADKSERLIDQQLATNAEKTARVSAEDQFTRRKFYASRPPRL
jgi:hypothetical protein